MSEATPTNVPESLYPARRDSRPTKVAIIGAGAVGSTLAYACVIRGVAREVVLQDINKQRVEAEALDIAHGIQFTPAASVAGSDDVEICRDAEVVVITAGAKQKPGQSRLDLAGTTVSIMEKILPGLLAVAPHAVYILVANPVDVVTYTSLKISGLSPTQMFGSGTVLDTSRLRYLVSLETGTAVQNIHAYVAGEHGDSEVPLWASAVIGNMPLSRWGTTKSGVPFDADLCARIGHEVMESAYKIIEGKGVTNYAVGLAVSRIIAAVLNDEQRVLTISTLLDGWEGISDVCMSVPTIVGREGAGRRLLPYISMAERDALTTGAIHLRDIARSLGY